MKCNFEMLGLRTSFRAPRVASWLSDLNTDHLLTQATKGTNIRIGWQHITVHGAFQVMLCDCILTLIDTHRNIYTPSSLSDLIYLPSLALL